MADPTTKFRLDQQQATLATLSTKQHEYGNRLRVVEIYQEELLTKEDSFIDWREWRTQVLIWATVAGIGLLATAIIFYIKAHL